jgi:hypothetical protein
MPTHNPYSVFPFAVNLLVVVAQSYLVISGRKYTHTKRVVFGFGGCSIIMILLPLAATMSPKVNFWIVFALLIIFGAFSGTAQGSVFSMAGSLPFKYMGAVMFGSGICGVSTNALRAVTLIAFPIVSGADDEKKNNFLSAVVFLSIASCVMVGIVVIQTFLVARNPFYIYYLDWDIGEDCRGNELDTDQEATDYNLANTVSDVAKSSDRFSKEVRSIARYPPHETAGTYLKAAKRNFLKT